MGHKKRSQGATAQVQLPVTASVLGTWQEPARVTKSIRLIVQGDTAQQGGEGVADSRIRRWLPVWIRRQRVGRKLDKTVKPRGSSLVIHSYTFPNSSTIHRFPSQHIAMGSTTCEWPCHCQHKWLLYACCSLERIKDKYPGESCVRSRCWSPWPWHRTSYILSSLPWYASGHGHKNEQIYYHCVEERMF